MREKLLENWLDKASERNLQIAFCAWLTSKQYRVVHSTRHSPIEQGKDVIAVNQHGQVCAYQLKVVEGRSLTKGALDKMHSQISALTNAAVEHPSIRTKTWHLSFLVLNGYVDEEAQDLINKINRGYVSQGFPERQVNTIVKGELLDGFNRMSDEFFPSDIENFNSLLNLYLKNGASFLPKAEFAGLIESCFPMLSISVRKKRVNDIRRAIGSAALTASVGLSPFTKAENHFAELEGWFVFLSYVSSTVEKFNLAKKHYGDIYELVEKHIFEGRVPKFVEIC